MSKLTALLGTGVIALTLYGCTEDDSGKTDEDETPADAYEGDNDGECTDGVDNDRNGLFDCDDPGCAGAPNCGSTGEGEGEGEGEATDGDGDGFSPSDGDCDDTDETVYPGADDVAVDGTDQDCDGLDGPDADNDGYVDAAAGGDDCNDGDASVFPGASEIWDDGIDQDCDGVADAEGSSCSADFTITTPDGQTATLDFCQRWSLSSTFEYDPDAAPKLGSIDLRLEASTEAEFDCRIEVAQDQICDAGYYDIADATGTVTLVTLDCADIDDEFETTIPMGEGYLRLDTIDTGTGTGSFAGVPLPVTLTGQLHVQGDGFELDGALSLSQTQIAGDSEEVAACATLTAAELDRDSDGQLARYFDGDDCDDTDPRTFTGAAELEAPTQCMTDSDEDGWGSTSPASSEIDAGTDCNDMMSTVYPGAVTEASSTECMLDADGDGFGRIREFGYDPGTDCNDFDASEYPGAVTEATSAECMRDADGDGYGDYNAFGDYDAGTDCNDSNATQFPGAVPEGSATDCMRDTDGDGFGDEFATAPFDAGTDCDDSLSTTFPGAAEIEDASACMADLDDDGWGDDDPKASVTPGSDCDDSGGSPCLPVTAVTGHSFIGDASGDYSGSALSHAGDLDGDGLDDVVVDARYSDSASASAGAVCVFFASTLGSATTTQSALADADVCAQGEGAGDDAGWTMAGLGDLDGDGTTDLLVGAPWNDDVADSAGKAYVVLGSTLSTASSSAFDLASADYQLLGEGEWDFFGYAAGTAGDVDGDGLADVLVAAPTNSDAAESAGKVYLLLGTSLTASTSTTISASSADVVLYGEAAGDAAGQTVAGAGDIDADGLADLLVFGADVGPGTMYVVLGDSVSTTDALDLGDADFIVEGETVNDYFGMSLASAGDLDGDGADDVVVGAHDNSDGGDDAGKAYVFLGGTLSTASASALDGTDADYQLVGEESYDTAGTGVSSAGDVDADGLPDLLIGAAHQDALANQPGKAYLIYGSTLAGAGSGVFDLSQADYGWVGEVNNDRFGDSVSGVGDVDGDLQDDVIVGAPQNADGGTTAGQSYLIYGSVL